MKTINRIILLLFALTQFTIAASFTYVAPSLVAIPFSGTTANATIDFTITPDAGKTVNDYYIQILVDGSWAADTDLGPSSYTITLTYGVHNIEVIFVEKLGPTVGKIHQRGNLVITAGTNVKIQNNFSGGSIFVENTSSPKSSPYYRASKSGDSFLIGAIEQSSGGIQRVWNTSGTNNSDWTHDNGNGNVPYSTDQITNYNVTNWNTNTTVRANLKKEYNITFKNKFVGYPNYGGQIIVNNGAPENAPSAVYKVVEQNTITAKAIYEYEISTNVGIKYTFENWQDESGVNVGSNLTLTASPNGNTTYTVKMQGKPIFGNSNYRQLRTNYNFRNIGDPVRLTWKEHPNSLVTQYKIYRKVFGDKSLIEQEKLIGTVNRGTTSWTDYDFAVGSSTTNIFLYYDVRAYYSLEGTESSIEYIHINGDLFYKTSDTKDADKLGITKFAIGNYPNPFNPTTIVNYQLPYSGMVKIKVYDMLGKEVVGLVNNIKDAGIYNVRFDGSNLASGTYLIHIQVTPTDAAKSGYVETKKMLLLR